MLIQDIGHLYRKNTLKSGLALPPERSLVRQKECWSSEDQYAHSGFSPAHFVTPRKVVNLFRPSYGQ